MSIDEQKLLELEHTESKIIQQIKDVLKKASKEINRLLVKLSHIKLQKGETIKNGKDEHSNDRR